jgi:ABC-type transporter Mla MlaB component
MSPARKKLKEKETLILEDVQTIDRIRKTHGDLQQALLSARHLEIDAAGITQADLSCLQLLCSAHRTAVREGKRLTLAGNFPPALQRAVEDNGYARPTSCGLDEGNTCLWLTRCKDEN